MNGESRIPVGTQVVVQGASALRAAGTGRDATGRIARDSGTGYVVALIDGRLIDARSDQLTTVGRSTSAPERPGRIGPPATLVTERTVYAALVGSELVHRQHGVEPDIRGIYQAPTSALWSLSKPPKHVAGPGANWFSWEVERFCELALKANPTCLDLLWSSRPVWVDAAGLELLDLRGAFLSQSIAPAYAAHALAQFKKLEESDRYRPEQRWVHAAHLLRLLLDGVALLRTGDVADSVAGYEDRLLAMLAGDVPWEQVESWRQELQRALDEAASATFLPATPDADRVDAWLIDLRRRDLAAEADEAGSAGDS